MSDLTSRQEDVLLALRCHINTFGWAPVVPELCKAVGGRPASVSESLTALERRGYIERAGGPRAIRLTLKAMPDPADELARAIASVDDPAQIARFAGEVLLENRRLKAELVGKSLAVDVQTGMRRHESFRAERFRRELAQLRSQLPVAGCRLPVEGELAG